MESPRPRAGERVARRESALADSGDAQQPAWDLQALGRREAALSTFEAAERAWSARGGARQVAIAKWSVAYCLRSLDRPRAALVILAPLASARASDKQLRRDVLEEKALDALAGAGLGVAR
jgi:hypothetical protein